MKKFIATIFISLITALALLPACTFVSFDKGISDEEIARQEELAERKKEYVNDIYALSDEDAYREEELHVYRTVLIDAINRINECDSDDDLQEVFDKYRSDILSIKTDNEYKEEELSAFSAYKQSVKDKIAALADMSDYRQAEVESIQTLIDTYYEKIDSAETYEDVDQAFVDCRIEVYLVKTDAELYAEEYEQLKQDTIIEINGYYNPSSYKEDDREVLEAIKQGYISLIEIAGDKQAVADLFVAYKQAIDAVKTTEEIYRQETVELINYLYAELINMVDGQSLADDDITEHVARCNSLRDSLLQMNTKTEVSACLAEQITDFVAQLSGNVSGEHLRNIYVKLLQNAVNFDEYRLQQQNELTVLTTKYAGVIISQDDVADIEAAYIEGKSAMGLVLNNDDMWKKEDEEFFAQMRATYGDGLLAMPEVMTEASDYYQLAAIIDWYAFYQVDYENFARGTFRIKLNYEHKYAQWEINAVYWYCELLRSAVGITAEFEGDDYLIITLVPYAIATNSNASDINRINRYNNLVEYNSDKSSFRTRADDFDDFAYMRNYKTPLTGIWNTQQLWYALEHEYLPVCINGSPAEATLNRAKQVLREIIKEGMSDEEKVFTVYAWIAANTQFDSLYTRDITATDRYLFPDEKTAKSKAYHIEGMLFEGVAVCEGYAKTYLLLLRMEDIKCFRYMSRDAYYEGKNAMYADTWGYGSHAFLAIPKGDGTYYLSDVENTLHGDCVTYHQLMVPPSLFIGYHLLSEYYPDMQFAAGISDYYKNLCYNGVSLWVENKQELVAVLNMLKNVSGRIQVAVYADKKAYTGIDDDINELVEEFGIIRKTATDRNHQLLEFILYK